MKNIFARVQFKKRRRSKLRRAKLFESVRSQK